MAEGHHLFATLREPHAPATSAPPVVELSQLLRRFFGRYLDVAVLDRLAPPPGCSDGIDHLVLTPFGIVVLTHPPASPAEQSAAARLAIGACRGMADFSVRDPVAAGFPLTAIAVPSGSPRDLAGVPDRVRRSVDAMRRNRSAGFPVLRRGDFTILRDHLRSMESRGSSASGEVSASSGLPLAAE